MGHREPGHRAAEDPWVDVTYCKYGTPYEADAAVDQHALEAEAEPVQARQPLRDVAGRHLRAAQRGPRLMEGQYESQPITRAALQRFFLAVREDCARGHEELAERLSIPD